MKPATGQAPASAPAEGARAGRASVSSQFIRREAALAASDAKHAKIVAQRFSLLRTRILREMRERGWRRLAVVPITPGAGGTYVAVNLSLAIARQPNTRVALIDLNLERPGIAAQLGIPGSEPISATLSQGRGLDSLIVDIAEAPNLSVLAPSAPEAAAAELLQDRALIDQVAGLHESNASEIAILDSSALLLADAALATLPLADALLLVADGRQGTAADMTECERLLAGMPPVMGIVLNKAED